MAVDREEVEVRVAVAVDEETGRTPGADAMERCRPFDRATGLVVVLIETASVPVLIEVVAGSLVLVLVGTLCVPVVRTPFPVPAGRAVMAGRCTALVSALTLAHLG